MLSKENRLKRSSSFQKVHKKGKHVSGKYGKLIILNRGDEGPSRFGVVVSAKKGDASERNSAKRKVRHVFRDICNRSSGIDAFYVIWSLSFTFEEVKKEIESMLENEIHNNGSN